MMQHLYLNDTDVQNLGLIPTDIDIPSPEPKLYQIEIPGKNGKLDITDFMGDVKFNNITITITYEAQLEDYVVRNILNQYNGQEVTLKLVAAHSVEQYTGRVTGYTIAKNNSTCGGTLTIDASPEVEYVPN